MSNSSSHHFSPGIPSRASRPARPWVVIPAKSLVEGKTRLAPVLTREERAELNREFLTHTLKVVAALESLVGTVVVSLDQAALELAREYAAAALDEGEPRGLNPALARAAAWATRQGATHVMTVSTDLPWLTSDDLQFVLDTALRHEQPNVTVAPDDALQGTNVMVVAPPGTIDYHYGIGSFRKHQAGALVAGASFEKVCRPGLLFDIDSPDDLARWTAQRRGTHPSNRPGIADSRSIFAVSLPKVEASNP